MPVFEATNSLNCSISALFDFLARPANLLLLSPPDLQLKLDDPPERLQQGSRLTVIARRWGIAQRMVSEVTLFEPETCIIEEQRQGPFRKLTHARRLEGDLAVVRLTDHIEFEPPGGMIGLLMNSERIIKEMDELLRFRVRRMKELLEPEPRA